MKLTLFIIVFFSAINSFGQDTVVTYYDANWKETTPLISTYYTQAIKADTVWRGYAFYRRTSRIYSDGYYRDPKLKEAHGAYTSYDTSGRIIQSGIYMNAKKEGVWIRKHRTGNFSDTSFFAGGIIKRHRGYDTDGKIFQTIDTDVSGKTWNRMYLSDGRTREEGEMVDGKKEGLYKVYVPEIELTQHVVFKKDSVISVECVYKDNRVATSCIYEKDSEFPGGHRMWQAYIRNKLAAYIRKNKKADCDGKVVVQFIIDKEGNVTEAKIAYSSNLSVNQAALDIILASPKWEAAIQYNRPVKSYKSQPITFVCADD